ncbi:acetyl-CoA synthetase-like protein [Microthyrium microscopicum]|uniref:Very long-chain fatty acid transport protein n=1 Tax=Microthyrium microscopicum TaxID=703497 RepID=A0A6A6UBS8_9PEZI|nr:acetyl-CoA synthetase-like protein [Microthyrium microscopicum]
MALIPAIAGTAAVSAYLNAKYHIAKDVRQIINLKLGERRVIEAVKKDKVSMWPYFEDQVNRLPENDTCLWSRTGVYTWRETWAQSNRYSQFLLDQGVQKLTLVGFYLTNSPEFIFAQLGTWAIGCAPALINHNLSNEALVHCVKLSATKILIVDWEEECVARIEGSRAALEALGVKIIILDDATRQSINSSAPIRPPDELRSKIPPSFPQSLIYTSGSTGYPKAVPYSCGRTLPFANRRKSHIGIKAGPNGDRYYVCMPMYHGTGGIVANSCMISGITLCIGKKFSTTKFWDDIRDSEATAFVYVGEAARYLLAQPPSPRDRDHKVHLMFGNGLRPDVWKKFQDRFGIETVAEFFNSSEGVFGTLNVSKGGYLQASVGHHGLIMRQYLKDYYATAKVDLDTGDLYRDPSTTLGVRTPLEEGGEVIVAVPDPSIFPGYWQNSEATNKKFARNLFKDGDLWYRTGDALRRTPDGHWHFMDRLGDTYRWKSENVATMEVAQTLGHMPGIAEAAVYGVLVPGHDGRAGCAAIHLNSSQQLTPHFLTDLLRYSNKQLPKYAVPVFIRVMREIKPMHNQKQNKIPLKKDGISLDAVYGIGKDVKDAEMEGKDLLFWYPGALGLQVAGLAADRYVPLTRSDWEGIVRGGKEARL